jgi:hypothetical protein
MNILPSSSEEYINYVNSYICRMPIANQDRYSKLVNRLFKEEEVEYDSSRFNDPIAEKTNWGPALRGGTNYRTRKLVQVRRNRIEFKSGCTQKAFGCIFMFVGFIVASIFAATMLFSEFRDFGAYLAVSAGVLFVAVGFFINRLGNVPIVFDKDLGYYWYSRKDPSKTVNIKEIKQIYSLSDIHALQLIPEYLSGGAGGLSTNEGHGSGGYTSFEINLVLKDASRVNVIDHGDLNQILIDIQHLSEFLNVPIWDALDSDA